MMVILSGFVITCIAATWTEAWFQLMLQTCPGADFVLKQNGTNITVLPANVAGCTAESLPNFSPDPGAVFGRCNVDNTYCRLHLRGPQDKPLRARLSPSSYQCSRRDKHWTILFYDSWNFSFPYVQRGLLRKDKCSHSGVTYNVVSATSHLYISYINHPTIQIEFSLMEESYLRKVYISPRYGYIIPVHSVERFFQRDVPMDVEVPFGFVTMVSFQDDSFRLFTFGTFRETVLYCNKAGCLDADSFGTDPFYIEPASVLRVAYGFKSYKLRHNNRILFSFHLSNETLKKVDPTHFNCSVDIYPRFWHHLECNRQPECEDGRDEGGHCPYSSAACDGLVASRGKCFRVLGSKTRLEGEFVRAECRKNGADMVSIKTEEERADFLQVYRSTPKLTKIYVGYLGGGESIPFMYRRFDRWADKTMIYNLNHLNTGCCCDVKPRTGAQFEPDGNLLICVKGDHQPTYDGDEIFCESKVPPKLKSSLQKVVFQTIQEGLSHPVQAQHSLVVCPQTGMTHSFLSCDFEARCANNIYSKVCTYLKSNSTYADSGLTESDVKYQIHLYICDDDFTSVLHTFLCDFRKDCPDNSDESFCEHLPCTDRMCANGQCVSESQICNGYPDCVDESDEELCYVESSSHLLNKPKSEVYLINLDGMGHFNYLKMKDNETCPDTHYRCTSELLYCLPIYTRCNGFNDCVYGEDEEDCKRVECPGFYLCRGSENCVHLDNVCDGHQHCPRGDDELVCDGACPQDCFCQAHDFLCPRSFSVHLFPQLRYLDASGSGMLLSHMKNNTYLAHLSLAKCFLTILHDTKLPNLRSLILSNNYLRTVPVDIIFSLPKLRFLTLANNPLTLFARQSSAQTHKALRRMDLSKTLLEVLKAKDLVGFYHLRYLNLSFSAINTIEYPNFQNFSHLRKLDIRGNPVVNFPSGLFSGLKRLLTVHASNDRLCCLEMVIQTGTNTKCYSPQARLPLCESMLQSDFYRVVWWLASLTAILGNSVSLVSHFWAKGSYFTSNFLTFVFNLNIANLSTGIYICIISIANEVFYGVFFQFEDKWIKSMTCTFAGFLFLLSSEMTVLVVLFITLDHIIVLCFPSSVYRFNASSTTVACVSAWFLSFSMASISVLQRQSNWIRFGYDSLCHPGLLEQYYFKKEFVWFFTTEIFHFMIFLVIIAGQCIVYKATPKYRIVADPVKQAAFYSARLLVKIASSHALCWISMTCLSLANLAGVAESDMIHVAAAVVVLSLHSAVNPILHLWSLATCRRQEEKEERVLKMLKSQRLLSRNNAA